MGDRPSRDPTRRGAIGALVKFALVSNPLTVRLFGAGSPGVDLQPFLAQARRLVDAMAYLGEPFTEPERQQIDTTNLTDPAHPVAELERVLGTRCLLDVRINPESRISVERGPAPAPARLVEHGWRAYLVKVRNEAGVTGALTIESPQARPVYRPGTGLAMAPPSVRPSDITDRWLELSSFGEKPMEAQLSGLDLEYRIVVLYSRDGGRREAQLGAMLGAGTDDIGFRNRAAVLFEIAPSRDVTFRIHDERGRPSMASLVIADEIGRIYPARSKRLAPDFYFQDQVYRADGEAVRLPAGTFTITCGRGPEYLPEARVVNIDRSATPPPIEFRLRRWIDPPSQGWYSGDHHIHAAGCSHYESPTEGVRPEDMMRHVLGEALSVGAVLNWGPSYYHQRQYFEAKDNKVSTAAHLLRYDLEVSGFPSSHCGHLVLLRVRDQDYPDTRQIEDWPSWDLPILKWAKGQGAITGFAHSGLGLQVKSHALPNYEMPGFNSIGANEYIVDVAHDVVDFISTADTPFPYELNIWYHTLNCGFRTRVSGETDFPCMSDDRVGAGRSYVHLPQTLTYDAWCDGVRAGRCYVSDGFGHLMNFSVNGLESGTNGSELPLSQPRQVRASVRAACLLPAERPASTPNPDQRPFWTPEHARIAGSRDVVVEVVVNGRPVTSQSLTADGVQRDLVFDVRIDRSSWIALRILGCAHTNPIFLVVGGRPIRASRQSAEWCIKAVDQCGSQKLARIRFNERESAQRAFNDARARYQKILSESDAD